MHAQAADVLTLEAVRGMTYLLQLFQHHKLSSSHKTLVHLVSKTYWATCRCQPSLLTASCCATSQVMPMLFKSFCMVSSSSFVVFQAFSLSCLNPCVQLVLAVCCHPFAERARAVSVVNNNK